MRSTTWTAISSWPLARRSRDARSYLSQFHISEGPATSGGSFAKRISCLKTAKTVRVSFVTTIYTSLHKQSSGVLTNTQAGTGVESSYFWQRQNYRPWQTPIGSYRQSSESQQCGKQTHRLFYLSNVNIRVGYFISSTLGVWISFGCGRKPRPVREK